VASDLHVPVGTVPGYGADIEVCRHPDGSAAIWTGFTGASVSVPPESVAALAELIQRAAMPGQPPVARHPLYGCCEHCEHCGKCQQPGSCHHGYEQPPHLSPCRHEDCGPGHKAAGEAVVPGQPLTVAAVDPAAMEALGQLADAVQEAGEHG
jgi:hypothetical protein